MVAEMTCGAAAIKTSSVPSAMAEVGPQIEKRAATARPMTFVRMVVVLMV
jgi:hypothetical protein